MVLIKKPSLSWWWWFVFSLIGFHFVSNFFSSNVKISWSDKCSVRIAVSLLNDLFCFLFQKKIFSFNLLSCIQATHRHRQQLNNPNVGSPISLSLCLSVFISVEVFFSSSSFNPELQWIFPFLSCHHTASIHPTLQQNKQN